MKYQQITTWTTKDGNTINIKDMPNGHLKNSIRLMEKNAALFLEHDPRYQALVKEAVEREIWDRSKW